MPGKNGYSYKKYRRERTVSSGNEMMNGKDNILSNAQIFSHSELRRLAKNSGYINIEIVPCASLGFDFRHFILGNMASFLRKRICKRKVPDTPNWNAVPEERKRRLKDFAKANNSASAPLSRKFASSIMLIAERP